MLELESKKGAKEIYMFNHNEVFTVEPKGISISPNESLNRSLVFLSEANS